VTARASARGGALDHRPARLFVAIRYWGFEAEGEWTLASFVATGLLGLAVGLEFLALWPSLRVLDDEAGYRITLRWFSVDPCACWRMSCLRG
jgi:hypothetical protein